MGSKADGGKKCGQEWFVVFLMGEVTACSFADGNDPVERETR